MNRGMDDSTDARDAKSGLSSRDLYGVWISGQPVAEEKQTIPPGAASLSRQIPWLQDSLKRRANSPRCRLRKEEFLLRLHAARACLRHGANLKEEEHRRAWCIPHELCER